MTTAPPPCRICGQPQPLTPAGRTVRHYDNHQPASVKHCPGGRTQPVPPAGH